jgi:hypothetical protein
MNYRVGFAAVLAAAVGLATVPETAAAQVALANVRVHAEIDRVDRENRTLVLRGPSGNLFERRVPEDMSGFAARSPGEEVTVMFLSEIGLHLRKPGASLPNLSELDVPPGVPTVMRVIEAEVTQIDRTESAVSLKSTAGPSIEATFRLPPGLSLSDFTVGDRIDVAYVFPEVVSVETR